MKYLRIRYTWQWIAIASVGIGVCFSVLLISVAFGVQHKVTASFSSPFLQHIQGVSLSRTDTILFLLTVVVTAVMIVQTAATTLTLGITVMQERREEIAIRRQSGVFRSVLILEFCKTMLGSCLLGGLMGEAAGIGIGVVLEHVTVLPVEFTPISLLSAFPTTIVLALASTILPAWRAASASPALLRKV